MAHYAGLGSNAVEALARRYGIGKPTAFAVMDGGLENSSYCVETASGKYVLTIWDQKSLEQVTKLAKLLVYLTNSGICTSQVVAPPEQSLVMLHDDKPVMFKHYLEGAVRSDLSCKLLVQLGEEMARIHQLDAPAYVPHGFPYGRSHFHQLTESNIDHVFIAWLSEKERYLQDRIPQQLPMALIHGDLFFDNVIVQSGQLKAIIDFEEVSYYYRNFDVGMAIIGACRDQDGISLDKAASLVQGVQQQTPLCSIEQDSLKTFMVYAAVATAFWRFRQYHLYRPEPRNCDKHLEMQMLADRISDLPDAFFTELFTEKSAPNSSGKGQK